VGAVLLALLFTSAWTTPAADPPAKEEDLRRQLAAAQARADKHLYLYRIALAQREWTAHDADRAEQILAECPAALRGWEWHYLRRLCETGLVTFHGHTKAISSVAFSPDGARIASASLDGSVKVWDAATGKELLAFRKHRQPISHVTFSPDGKRIASAAYKMLKFSFGDEDKGEGEVKVWEADTGKELLTINRKHDVPLVMFAADGKRLVTQGEGKTLKVWDASTGKEVLTIKGLAEEPRGLGVSPDGKRIASAIGGKEGKPGEVKVWDADTGKEVLGITEPSGPVAGVMFSPDGKRLAGIGPDQNVIFWDMTTGKEVLRLRAAAEPLLGLAFSPDGKRLATSGMDRLIKVWDVSLDEKGASKSGKELFTLAGHTDWVAALAFSPDGKRLISGSGNPLADLFGAFFGSTQKRPAPVAKVWDATGGQEVRTFSGKAIVNSVAFSPDGKRLASAGEDGTVKVRDCTSGKEVLDVKGTAAVKCLAFSPDGKRLASGDAGNEVKVWDAATGMEILHLQGHGQAISAVAFSPDGKQLASASADQTVKLWDLQDGKEVATFKGHPGAVQGVAFSPDGKRLASVSWGLVSSSSINGVSKTTRTPGDVHVWDLATNKEALTLKGNWLSSLAVCFSPDGKLLATAADDQTVRLWDSGSGKEAATLKGFTAGVSSLAFSADGQRLVTSSAEGIKVWDVATALEVLIFRGPHGSIALSADGALLAAVSNQDVKLWDATPLSPEVLVERSARAAVQQLFDDGLLRSEVVEKVRKDPQLDAVGRKVAERLAEASQENANALNHAAWALVKQPGQDEAAYALALGRAETAHRLAGENVNILHTLAVAQYRAGKYKEALANLNRVMKLRGNDTFGGHPLDLAYLAMTHHHLGQHKEAREKLEEFRHRVSGEDLETLLREVESELNLVSLATRHDPITSVAFSPDGKMVVLGGGYANGGKVELWDVAGRQKRLGLEGHTSQVLGVAFAPDGKTVASCGDDKTVKIWNAADGKELRTLKGHTGPVHGVAYSPDSRRVVSAGQDGTFRTWEVESGKELYGFKGHDGPVLGVAYSPDGKRLASAGRDKTIRVWDAETGREVLVCKGHADQVEAVVWSPDGKRLASASRDKTVRVWDAVEGKEVFTLKGETGGAHVVAYSPDGKHLAVGYFDKVSQTAGIALHQADGGKEVQKVPAHRNWVQCVAFSPDGKVLLTTHGDNAVILQDLSRLKK
jgi:WD40 repeat protein